MKVSVKSEDVLNTKIINTFYNNRGSEVVHYINWGFLEEDFYGKSYHVDCFTNYPYSTLLELDDSVLDYLLPLDEEDYNQLLYREDIIDTIKACIEKYNIKEVWIFLPDETTLGWSERLLKKEEVNHFKWMLENYLEDHCASNLRKGS